MKENKNNIMEKSSKKYISARKSDIELKHSYTNKSHLNIDDT